VPLREFEEISSAKDSPSQCSSLTTSSDLEISLHHLLRRGAPTFEIYLPNSNGYKIQFFISKKLFLYDFIKFLTANNNKCFGTAWCKHKLFSRMPSMNTTEQRICEGLTS
jgi:hypothetical protein